MMPAAAFRALQNEIVLTSYRTRYPLVLTRERELREAIEVFEATERAKAVDDEKRDKQGMYYRLQRVVAERQGIVCDYRRRLRLARGK